MLSRAFYGLRFNEVSGCRLSSCSEWRIRNECLASLLCIFAMSSLINTATAAITGICTYYPAYCGADQMYAGNADKHHLSAHSNKSILQHNRLYLCSAHHQQRVFRYARIIEHHHGVRPCQMYSFFAPLHIFNSSPVCFVQFHHTQWHIGNRGWGLCSSFESKKTVCAYALSCFVCHHI